MVFLYSYETEQTCFQFLQFHFQMMFCHCFIVQDIFSRELVVREKLDTDISLSIAIHFCSQSIRWIYVDIPIFNFPIIISNIPAAPAYDVFESWIILYDRSSSQDFLHEDRCRQRSCWNKDTKFCGYHYELVEHYQMLFPNFVRICFVYRSRNKTYYSLK